MSTLTRQAAGLLRTVKLVHTIVWAFFAGCIVAVPAFAWQKRFDIVSALVACVLLEIVILGFNRWRCPLTPLAARYTDDRQDNFDIYLPLWLARHNKTIFGGLFVLGLLFSIARWRDWL